MTRTLILAICVSLVCSAALAQQRTFVSTSGSDANPCSRSLPCRNFAAAIAAVTTGGEVYVLDAGGYGTVTVTKAVTLQSVGLSAAITAFAGSAIVVNAPSATVGIRGLTLKGLGGIIGIEVQDASAVYIDDTSIAGFSSAGIDAELTGVLTRFDLHVNNVTARNDGQYGAVLSTVNGRLYAAFDHCRLEANTNGLRSDDNTRTTIANSVATSNGYGLVSDHGTMGPVAEINAESCIIVNNTIAGVAAGGLGQPDTIRLSNCTITENDMGIKIGSGGSVVSRSNNTLIGNVTDGAPTGLFSAQ